MNIALIVAGGIGRRMETNIPKQFICVKKKPIIVYTLEIMQKHPEIDMIQVVCIDGWQSTLKEYAIKFNINKLNGIVTGGNTRYISIHKGMRALKQVDDDDIIIVHDAVRPLVTNEGISNTIDVCKKHGNSMSVLECIDTMYCKESNKFTNEFIDRSKFIRGQTPEAISGKCMRKMYNLARERGLENDSISALQTMLGEKVYFSKGSSRNIKLTTIEDIQFFKAIIKNERGGNICEP